MSKRQKTADAAVTAVLDAGKTIGLARVPTGQLATGAARRGKVFFTTPDPLGEQDLEDAREKAGALEFGLLWKSARGEACGLGLLARRLTGSDSPAARLLALFAYLNERPMFECDPAGTFRPVGGDVAERIIRGRAKREEQAREDAEILRRMAAGDLSMIGPGDLDSVLFTKELRLRHLLDRHCREAGVGREELLLRHGLLESELDYHRRWVVHHLGLSEPAVPPAASSVFPDLPENGADAPRTLDRAGTSEIDDALSFSRPGEGRIAVCAHVCMPSLGMPHGSDLDLHARRRMSTVYLPHEKFTMLPRDAYGAYSLLEGERRPVVTVRAEIALASGEVKVSRPRAETVRIRANHFFGDVADDGDLEAMGFPDAGICNEITAALRRRREGRENAQRTRRTLFVADPSDIRITIATSGVAEELVAEMMILANSMLSALARERGIPIIYRVKGGSALSPKRHTDIGLPSYGWFTSPLRRYTDLVNLRQALGVLGVPGADAPVGKDELRPIMEEFDRKYPQAQQAQRQLERYWVLRHLANNPGSVWDATVKEGAEIALPELQVGGKLSKPPGRKRRELKVRPTEIDLYALSARFEEAE